MIVRRYTVDVRRGAVTGSSVLDDNVIAPAVTVFEPQDRARWTGLLTAEGHRIMRADERELGYLPRRHA